jgi:protein-S-isoprenylcysteine O-methyltransferase Ste14
MKIRITDFLPGFLNLITAVIVFIVSFSLNLRFPILNDIAKNIGIILVICGMSIVVVSVIYIKKAIFGEVKPNIDKLVVNGPYRIIRHPVYFGMTIAIAGVSISLNSWIGLLCVFIFFLPSEIYRAKLEEKALYEKFGKEWEKYLRNTGFFLPFKLKKPYL